MLELMMRRDVGMPLLFGSILLAMPLALLATDLIARSFRRRVARIMQELARLPARGVTPAPTNGTAPPPPPPNHAGLAHLRRNARLSYLMAASAFALVASVTFWYAFDLGSGSLGARALLTRFGAWAVFATPLPLGLVALHSRRVASTLLAVILWLAGMLAIGALCEVPTGLLHVWMTWAAAPTLLVISFASPRLRAGAPMLLTSFWLLALAAQVGLFVVADQAIRELGVHFTRPDLAALSFADALPRFIDAPDSSPVTQLIEMLEHGARQPVIAAAHPERAGPALVRLLAGWLLALALTSVPIAAMLLWQARRYRARRTSDVQLSLDVTFLLYALAYAAIALMDRNVSPWAAPVFMSAFVAYRSISGVLLRRQRASLEAARPQPLLLLRTFGHDARTQALIEWVSVRWRWLGPVHLIAGPDAAFATLSPHDFYDYMSGKLARRAVTDLQEFQRLARAPAQRDPPT